MKYFNKFVFLLSVSFLFSSPAFSEQARQCEFYISDVSGGYVYHGMGEMSFHIKIKSELKDKVTKVGFRGDLDGWRDLDATYYPDKQVYIVNLPMKTTSLDSNVNNNYEGAFFVETTEGATYWINNGGIDIGKLLYR